MSIADERYKQLTEMVQQGMRAQEPPAPRTEAEDDRLALESMILDREGPEALGRYRARQAAIRDDNNPGVMFG